MLITTGTISISRRAPPAQGTRAPSNGTRSPGHRPALNPSVTRTRYRNEQRIDWPIREETEELFLWIIQPITMDWRGGEEDPSTQLLPLLRRN
jgi:hypothetical protein